MLIVMTWMRVKELKMFVTVCLGFQCHFSVICCAIPLSPANFFCKHPSVASTSVNLALVLMRR